MAELQWKGKKPFYSPQSISDPYTEFTEQQRRGTFLPLATSQYYTPLENSPTPIPASAQWYNRLVSGDKNDVLMALAHEFTAQVKLIYIDPPFMTGRTFHTKTAEAAVAYQDLWKNDLDAYLQWLYETFSLLHTLLAPDGSMYVHLDWRTTHYARILLDEIFATRISANGTGAGFKNEIIWHYQSGGRTQKYFARKHDTILLYTKSPHYTFHGERVSKRRGTSKRNHMRKETTPDGRVVWSIRSNGRMYTYDEDTRLLLDDVWSDISHLHQRDPERTGYATQKPAALLERILLASSDENDLILDCFCGSGVTPIVAEHLGRRWIACDKSQIAITMTQERLLKANRHTPFALQYVSPQGEHTSVHTTLSAVKEIDV